MNQIKVELQSTLGNDRQIAEAAWVSSISLPVRENKTDEQIEKLISFLAEHKHSTPFESVVFRFWMRLPIVSDRQVSTHRWASHNGLSGRYRTMPNEFLDIPKDVADITKRIQPNDNELLLTYSDLMRSTNMIYQEYLDKAKLAEKDGVISNDDYKRFREFYRGMIPLNNMTERITIMNLRSFANFYSLRSSKNAQPEIQFIANRMLEEIQTKNICPIAIKYVEKFGWNI